MSARIAKAFAKHLLTAKDVMDALIEEKVIKKDELQWHLERGTRKEKAIELKKQGLSNRKIARIMGVNASTIDRDVSAAKAAKPAALAASDVPDWEIDNPELTPEERWYNSCSGLAGEALSMTAYWRKHFGDFTKFTVTSELVTLATQAATEWTELAKTLGGIYHEAESTTSKSAA